MEPYSVKTWVRQEDGTVHEETEQSARPASEPYVNICCNSLDKYQFLNEHDKEKDYLRKYYERRSDLQHLLFMQ